MQGIFSAKRTQRVLRKTLGILVVLSIAATIFLPAGISFATDSGLKLQYRCRKPDEKTADLRPYFQIVNNTDTDIELSTLKIRYWYTNDGAADESYESWWATGEDEEKGGKKDMVTSAFGDAGGNHYLELGFTPEAGMLEKNGGFMETNGCVNRGDKSQYTQTGDYSYDPSFEELKDWDKVTLYQDGKLVWGVEPKGAEKHPPAADKDKASDKPAAGTVMTDSMAASPVPPGGLKPSEVPQFVAIGFDDNFQSGDPASGRTGGMAWANKLFGSRKNPAGKGDKTTYDGTTTRATYLVNTKYIMPSNKQSVYLKKAWHEAMLQGSEITLHTHTHPHGREDNFTVEKWQKDMQKNIDWLTKPFDENEQPSAPNENSGVGVPPEDLCGFRAPYWEFNDNMYKALKNVGLVYDCSLSDGHQASMDGTNFNWPYTLDNGPAEAQDSVVEKHPGIWIMPHYTYVVPPDDKCEQYGVPKGLRGKMKKAVSTFDTKEGRTASSDNTMWNTFKLQKAEFLAIMKYTLDLRLAGNRCPMMPCFHTADYTDASDSENAASREKQEMLEEFIDYALSKPEVRVVSMRDVLDWIRGSKTVSAVKLSSASVPAAKPETPTVPETPPIPEALLVPAVPSVPAAESSAALTAASGILFSEDFEDCFTALSGVFNVISDGDSMVYSTKSPGIDRSFAGQDDWTDYSVESDVKVLSWNSPENRVIGIMARGSDCGNYYSFTYMNNQLMIRKRVKGLMIDLAAKKFDFAVNRWYKFKGTVDGTSLKFYVDGVEQLSAADNTFGKGKAGVIAYKGEPAVWDNFAVYGKSEAVPEVKTPEPKPEPKPELKPEPKPEPKADNANTLYSSNFDNGEADGFTPTTGEFEIVQEGAGKAYSSVASGARSAVGDIAWTDYVVKSDVKVGEWATPTDTTVGLMARFLDNYNYYIAIYEDSKLYIKKKFEGEISDLAEKDFTFNTNQKYTFTFEAAGKELKFLVDGAEQLKATDDALPEGQAGVIQFNANPAIWDNFSVTAIGKGTDGPAAPKNDAEKVIAKTIGNDSFGIGMIYPTREGGSAWDNKWGTNEKDMTISSGSFAPDDPQLQFRGDGDYIIYGKSSGRKGQLKLWGAAPRIYVYNKEKKWNNVEVTFYGYTESFSKTAPPGEDDEPVWTFAGLEAVVQTDHSHFDSDIEKDPKLLCYCRGYGGRMLFDGRCDIEKECAHHLPNGEKQAGGKMAWPDRKQMPLKQWIGLKVISRACENNTKMKLEVWRDLTDGLNGGAWEKITEFTDYEGWSSKTNTCCEEHRGKILNVPEFLNTIYLRTDGLHGKDDCQYYKNFTVREIEPEK